jgi:hypothetical protein
MESPFPRQGSLAEIGFCEVLAALCRGRETGVLRLDGGSADKSVYLQQGRIVFASSKDPDDRLGELLLTRGIIQREQLEQATLKVGAGRRLGTILVEMGILPASDLPRWVREQVKEILFSLFSWTDGAYRFEEGPFSSEEAITLRLSLAEIFLSGLKQVQKWSVLRKGAGEIRLPYRLAGHHQDLLKEAGLGDEEKKLLALLEAKPVSMEQAALESGLSTLRVYQLFFAFRVLGAVIPNSSASQESLEAPPAGRSAKRDAPRVMAPESIPETAAPAPTLEIAPSLTMNEPTPTARPGKTASAASPPVALAPPAPVTAAGAEAGVQTVILKMPILDEPPLAASPSPPLRENKNSPAALQVSDSPPATAPGKDAGTASASKIPRKPPAPPAPVSRAHITTSDALPSKDTPQPVPAAKRAKTDYRVVRMEGERLDGSGAQHIEDLLRQWSGKGYRLSGVVPGRKEGLFNSSSCCFFIFERDPHS